MTYTSLPILFEVNPKYCPKDAVYPPSGACLYLRDLTEYLLIISPPEVIKNDVARYKNLLGNNISSYYDAYHSIAHLTVAAFMLHKSREKVLFQSLREAIAEEDLLTLTIAGFSFFKRNGLLFLKINETESFSQLSKNIKKKSILAYLPARFKNFTYFPHLTIGKNLGSHFDLACSLFKDTSYTHTFTAESALLLKRGRDEKFVPVQEFPFLSRPARQLNLFDY